MKVTGSPDSGNGKTEWIVKHALAKTRGAERRGILLPRIRFALVTTNPFLQLGQGPSSPVDTLTPWP